jgi:hypothetical protein
MFKKFVSAGRSEARDAKKNERHVCGPASPSRLCLARTKLTGFFNILLEGDAS